MSAELLREAAALMRSRASDVFVYHSSPWRIEPGPAGWSEIRSTGEIVDDFVGPGIVLHDTYVCQMDTSSTAEHIASWHPAVALAVADWLEREAALHESVTAMGDLMSLASKELGAGELRIQISEDADGMAASTMPQAEAVARTYLGRPA